MLQAAWLAPVVQVGSSFFMDLQSAWALLAKGTCLSGTCTPLLMPGHCLAKSLHLYHNTCMRLRSLSLRPAGSQGNTAQEARKACLDVMLLAVEQEEPGLALQAADLLKQVRVYTGHPAQHGLHHGISMLRHDGLCVLAFLPPAHRHLEPLCWGSSLHLWQPRLSVSRHAAVIATPSFCRLALRQTLLLRLLFITSGRLWHP